MLEVLLTLRTECGSPVLAATGDSQTAFSRSEGKARELVDMITHMMVSRARSEDTIESQTLFLQFELTSRRYGPAM